MAQSKKKLSSNSDFLHVNGLYKKLKLGLDEVKSLIQDTQDIENLRRQQVELKKEAQIRELKHIQELSAVRSNASERENNMISKYY